MSIILKIILIIKRSWESFLNCINPLTKIVITIQIILKQELNNKNDFIL
jgi:hypothetical protein